MFGYIQLGTAPARIDRHRLAGIVTVDGQPARRLVVVFDRLTMVMVAVTWSFPTTGAWQISGIPEYPLRQLLVMSVDHTGNYNAEVADYISQVTA
jgi:hypothetical protein